MRLRTKEYKGIMQEKGLTADQICRSTGLSEFSLNWILDNGGFTSDGTLEALALAADVDLKGIVRPDPRQCGKRDRICSGRKDSNGAVFSGPV